MSLAITINSFAVRWAQLRPLQADTGYLAMHDPNFPGWHFGPVVWALALALVVVAIVVAVRSLK